MSSYREKIGELTRIEELSSTDTYKAVALQRRAEQLLTNAPLRVDKAMLLASRAIYADWLQGKLTDRETLEAIEDVREHPFRGELFRENRERSSLSKAAVLSIFDRLVEPNVPVIGIGFPGGAGTVGGVTTGGAPKIVPWREDNGGLINASLNIEVRQATKRPQGGVTIDNQVTTWTPGIRSIGNLLVGNLEVASYARRLHEKQYRPGEMSLLTQELERSYTVATMLLNVSGAAVTGQ
jgi:hypothetical protein